MFVQTEITPNPNSIKFLPGKIVTNQGSFEVTKKDETNNELIRNLLSVNGVEGIFLGKNFISVNDCNQIFGIVYCFSFGFIAFLIPSLVKSDVLVIPT